jgi:hypothetical protein
MMTVRLFCFLEPGGFVGFDDTSYRMRPAGILSDDSVAAIRGDLEAGYLCGTIGKYNWYRQSTPYCPIVGKDPKPCPCDDEVCGEEIP